jgi:hypothetical protein
MKIYPQPPGALTREDFRVAGFRFEPKHIRYGSIVDEFLFHVEFSPRHEHHAVLFRRATWWGALLWVDGVAVDVPRDDHGEPLCEDFAEWADDRFFAVQIDSWEHPRLDPSKCDFPGDIRGLLIWDTEQRRRYLELPGPGQAWTTPRLRVRDGM